jgi:ankyrin repeat protein
MDLNLKKIIKIGNLIFLQDYIKENKDIDFNLIFDYACCKGNLDAAQLLLKINPLIDIKQKLFAEVCWKKAPNLSIAKWLKFVKPSLEINLKLFVDVCWKGKLDIAQWLIESNSELYKDNCLEIAFRAACSRGKMNIAQWLLQIKSDLNISANNDFAFREACTNRQISMAQWLLEIKPNIDISAKNNLAFRNACVKGHLDVAQWLYKINPLLFDSDKNDSLFFTACLNGKIEVAQWLYNLNSSIDEIYFVLAFKSACRKGYLELVKWLFNIKPLIQYESVFTFAYACVHGQLETAKWLITNIPNINISKYNNFIFRETCEKEHLEVAKWLCTLNSKYSIVIDESNKILSYSVNNINIDPNIRVQLDSINLEDQTCSICYESQVNIQTKCKHNFCRECINMYCEFNNFNTLPCPYCRTEVIDFYLIE